MVNWAGMLSVYVYASFLYSRQSHLESAVLHSIPSLPSWHQNSCRSLWSCGLSVSLTHHYCVHASKMRYSKRFCFTDANRGPAGGVPLRLRYPILQYVPCGEMRPIWNQEHTWVSHYWLHYIFTTDHTCSYHSWPQFRCLNRLGGYLVCYTAVVPMDREAERYNRGAGASATGDWHFTRFGEEGERRSRIMSWSGEYYNLKHIVTTDNGHDYTKFPDFTGSGVDRVQPIRLPSAR